MCDKFPDCDHAGPIVEPVPGFSQHCQSGQLLNSQCPYIGLGCQGCTWKATPKVALEIARLLIEAEISRQKKAKGEAGGAGPGNTGI